MQSEMPFEVKYEATGIISRGVFLFEIYYNSFMPKIQTILSVDEMQKSWYWMSTKGSSLLS